MAVPSFYSQGDPLFSDAGPSDGLSWQIPGDEGCSGPGLDCSIILHEANTGWWFAPAVTNCQGDCPGAPSYPPVPLSAVLCQQAWLEEVSIQLGHLPQLGDVFPAWALSQALIDPTLHFNIDGAMVVCGLAWVKVPITITPHTCPKGFHWDASLQKCVPTPKPPPAKCPPGYTWDATTGKCVLIMTVNPEQPDQDEFQDCCDETQVALANLASLISKLGTGGGPDWVCCANIVHAIGAVATELTAIAAKITPSTGAGTPVDLRQIERALATIAAELGALGGTTGHPVNVHIDNPAPLVDVKVDAPPTDVSGITKALTEANTLQDIPQDIIDQLVREGAMSAEMGQLVQGAAAARVRSTSAISDVMSLLDKLYKHFGGGPSPTFPSKETLSSTIAKGTSALFEATFKASGAVFSPIVNGILNAHNSEIATMRNIAPCGERAPAVKLLTEAIGAAVAAHFASVAVEAVYPTKNLGFEKIADLIAAIAGIEDIIGGLIGVEIKQLVAIPHTYCINEQGRTILPGMGDAAGLHARGLITAAQADQLLAFNGLSAQYAPPTLTGAYSGISARQLIRLFATGLFSPADIQDELTFAGMRPASQHRYQLVAPYLATASERNQLRAALEAEYSAGLMTDAELTGAIDSAEHNTDRDSLILDRVHAQEITAIAKALEAEYGTQYTAGLIPHDVYTAHLLGMGLQQWKVDALAGIIDAKRAATLARQMAAAERALEKETAAKERQAAMQAYADGHISQPILVATLVSTGLTIQQASAWSTIAVLKKQGSLRWIYGLQLQPAAATLLKERVAALNEQLVKGYITAPQYVAHLEALQIPAHWVNGLLAKGEATIAKTKGGALLNVQTS